MTSICDLLIFSLAHHIRKHHIVPSVKHTTIKLFQTHDPEYLTYINSSDKKMPNLCYCEDIEDLHLNKIIDLRIIAIYDISNIN